MLQTLVVALILAAAALYLARRGWNVVRAARKKDAGCGGDCCGH